MAKVIITIEDTPEETVNVAAEFDPPAKRETITPAQATAILMVQAAADTDPDAVPRVSSS